MKYQCMDCSHQFDVPGKTYADLDLWCTTPIAACPDCGSDDYMEVDDLMDIASDRLNSFSEESL